MAELKELMKKFEEVARNPKAQFDKFQEEGKKVVIFGPLYGPQEIAHSMGLVPFEVWGVDEEVNEAKKYFPAFIPSLLQTILEEGIRGDFKGAIAYIQPQLSDSTKAIGENWKYAVKDIPFVPMQFPQNRVPSYGTDFTEANYRKQVIADFEKYSGVTFDNEKLKESIAIYNEHNALMREVDELMSVAKISNVDRNSVFKSACYMLKEDHSALLKELIEVLKETEADEESKRVLISGLVADSPNLLEIFDEMGLKIVGDDIAQESRQYRTDTPDEEDPVRALAQKFSNTGNCSLLYDAKKGRVEYVRDLAKARKAKGVIFLLTKFSDPEEFDLVLMEKILKGSGIKSIIIEIDRQMQNYEQAKTAIQTFSEIL